MEFQPLRQLITAETPATVDVPWKNITKKVEKSVVKFRTQDKFQRKIFVLYFGGKLHTNSVVSQI